MRNKLTILAPGLCALVISSCHSLDLNPLSEGASDNWYSSEKEVELAANDFYKSGFWHPDGDGDGSKYGSYADWSDDCTFRTTGTAFELGTINGQTSVITNYWDKWYKVISHTNSLLENYTRALDNGADRNAIMRYVGEAHFFRAWAYSLLVEHFGDVPLVDRTISIEEAFAMGRTAKRTVLDTVYADFDRAASLLPESYSGAQRATSGAAMAFKARIALYMGDYEIARDASKAVIDGGQYSLQEKYEDLFWQSTKSSPEFIFTIPRSIELDSKFYTKQFLTRLAGGYTSMTPSWDLLAAYTCTDGLTIDQSPLFDPHNPFSNRDPRLSMTIVPHGSMFLGYEFNPSPAARTVRNAAGSLVKNNDSRAVNVNASYNGLAWKKGIDSTWMDNGYYSAQSRVYMRYADVLLMYAEAKIELGDIDASVIDAMNTVRARAYGVDKSATGSYPAFTIKPQAEMRRQLRIERRMELAREYLRYSDIKRWRIAETVMNRPSYGLLDPASTLLSNVVNTGNWFWGVTPAIDENGCPDLSEIEAKGWCRVLYRRVFEQKHYLWPIPTSDIEINPNMTQNEGY